MLCLVIGQIPNFAREEKLSSSLIPFHPMRYWLWLNDDVGLHRIEVAQDSDWKWPHRVYRLAYCSTYLLGRQRLKLAHFYWVRPVNP